MTLDWDTYIDMACVAAFVGVVLFVMWRGDSDADR